MCCTIIYMPKLILCCSTFNLIRAFSFWLGVSLWVKCIFEAIFAPCSRGQKRKKMGICQDCRGISIWTQAGLVQTLIYLRRKSFGIIVRLKDEAPPSFEQKPEGFAKTLTGMKNYLPHSLQHPTPLFPTPLQSLSLNQTSEGRRLLPYIVSRVWLMFLSAQSCWPPSLFHTALHAQYQPVNTSAVRKNYHIFMKFPMASLPLPHTQ